MSGRAEIVLACLLLASATTVWPRCPRPALRGGRGRRIGLRWLSAGRVVGLVAGGALLAAAAATAGLMGLLAAGMLLGTGALLVRRMLAERRRRRAMPEILRGLRALGRELRSGADPLAAARSAAAAGRGAGARTLTSLVQQMQTADPNLPESDGPADDLDGRISAVLRSGWLLTRWHGVAFGRVVAGIADDLSDQVAAAEARSAQLAGPRMSGYVMAALPLMGLLLGAGMGVSPVAVLLGSPLGNLLLVVGVALMCGGLLWSARIVGR